jgi:hydroxyacylglutathione hydrolase
MALVFEQMLDAPMGDASYLVGDDGAGVAAVIDPQIDTGRYLDAAARHGVSIRFIVQTHVHEDFVSGARALAQACGTAQVCVGTREAPRFGFDHRPVADGTVLELGSIRLTVKDTPGHTPEHIALLVAQGDAEPFAVFSGGSLLAGTAGRTDLLGPTRTGELTRAQFDTLRSVFLALPDGVIVYPTHVHGSPCGAAIGDKVATTIGYERRHNALLRHSDFEGFRRAALEGLPPKPSYYPRLKDRNTAGEASSPSVHGIRALTPAQFRAAAEDRSNLVLDTRQLLAFGGGHVPGAINIGADGHFAVQAGWVLDPARGLLLVLDSAAKLEAVVTELARTGLRQVAGCLAGGMTAWEDAGLPLDRIEQLHVRELAAALGHAGAPLPLDVRSPGEWAAGHVPQARHVFLPDLTGKLASLPRDRRIAVYCDSGYRASIGASLLRAHGFDVANVPGSWQAWRACGLPVER